MIEIKIEDGTGDFSFRGLKDCTFFEYKNRSKFLVWEMNWNTLVNYFIGQLPKQQVFYLRHMDLLTKNLENGTVDDSNAAELLTPMLNSFSNGTYRIEFKVMYHDYFIIKTGITTYTNTEGEKHIEKGVWAGGLPYIYAIQDHADEERVEYYLDLIKKGYKPQVILMRLQNSNIDFILDGHHKLEACQRAPEAMHAIQITKLDNFEASEDEILLAFEKTGEGDYYKIRLKDHLEQIKKQKH